MNEKISRKRQELIDRNNKNLDQFIAALKRIETFKTNHKENKTNAIP